MRRKVQQAPKYNLTQRHRSIGPAAAAATVAVALGAWSGSHADAATWTGANISAANNPPTKPNAADIDDPNNWTGVIDASGVPGQTDTAILNWSTASSSSPNLHVVTVGPSAIFNPGALELNAGTSSSTYLQVDKDLNLTHVKVTGAGTSGGGYTNRLRFGVNTGATVNLTGATPFKEMLTWAGINVGNGTNKVVFNVSNADISIPTLITSTTTLGNNSNTNNYAINGGLATLTAAQQATAPEMRFTAVGGTITLASPGYRSEGSLSLGNVGLYVRNDQTWEADPAAYVRMNFRTGDNTSQLVAITSINGGRLDNLSKLNLVINGGTTNTAGSSFANGMRLGGGTYGSLRFTGGSTSFRDNYLVMTDDVKLVGNVVTPGVYNSVPANQVNAAPDPDYGLLLQVGTATNTSYKRLMLNGHDLNVTKGVLIDDPTIARTTGGDVYTSIIDATDGTLSAGGPVVIQSTNAGPAAKSINAASVVSRSLGLRGNAASVFNFGDDYSPRVMSINGAGLQSSTVNLVGGASTVHTFEVGDAASKTGLNATASFNIGTLNVGTLLAVGNVQLVNDYLNDNPIAVDEDVAVAKAGEKLIVGDLNIAAGSTLDVNAQPVLLGSAATLSILGNGTLDLNTGLTLDADDLVTTFVGLGDQTIAWNLVASNVIDSDNPGVGFIAVLSGGNTVWQATLVPEPGTAAIAFGTTIAFALRRRRRA